MNLLDIYNTLLRKFGRQNWWPVGLFPDRVWEVCVGAILTQNTNWKNVEKAMQKLKENGLVEPENILKANIRDLENAVQPAGFYKQKAERLKTFAGFFLGNKNPSREELLGVKGIGPETADSILLYAFDKPFFVVDAYTRRIFSRLGFLNGSESYEEVRVLFEKNLPKDVEIYKEFHALIVELAKRHCRKRPECGKCLLRGSICNQADVHT